MYVHLFNVQVEKPRDIKNYNRVLCWLVKCNVHPTPQMCLRAARGGQWLTQRGRETSENVLNKAYFLQGIGQHHLHATGLEIVPVIPLFTKRIFQSLTNLAIIFSINHLLPPQKKPQEKHHILIFNLLALNNLSQSKTKRFIWLENELLIIVFKTV